MSSRIPILIIISLVLALQPYARQAARVSSMGAVDHQTSWNGAKEIPSRKMFESFMENFARMTRNQDAWRVGSQVSPRMRLSRRDCNLPTCVTPRLFELLSRARVMSGGTHTGGFLSTAVGPQTFGRRRRS